MTSCSRTGADPAGGGVRRARPLLGTIVAIRVAGLGAPQANAAVDRGFAAVADIHRLMSFHEAGSDLSRLNREAWQGPVAVDPRTLAVLRAALALAEETGGLFDPAIGGLLGLRGLLPAPDGAPLPDPAATWRDVALRGDGTVRFARPLWLDLGGIAKGHAVDAALVAMALPPEASAVVDAGGDLRVAGPITEPVELAVTTPGAVPVVMLENGALAASTGAPAWGAAVRAHFHGRTRRAIGTRSFAAVAAPSCGIADALTKPVLALGRRAEPLLRRHGAQAYLYSDRHGWRILGEAA